VYPALAQSVSEDERIRALPESDPARTVSFTPVVASEVIQADRRLAAILGDRVSTRADLSRQIALGDDVLNEAVATMSAVRNHLYANLPEPKTEPVPPGESRESGSALRAGGPGRGRRGKWRRRRQAHARASSETATVLAPILNGRSSSYYRIRLRLLPADGRGHEDALGLAFLPAVYRCFRYASGA
jgi:hypothetical protein